MNEKSPQRAIVLVNDVFSTPEEQFYAINNIEDCLNEDATWGKLLHERSKLLKALKLKTEEVVALERAADMRVYSYYRY